MSADQSPDVGIWGQAVSLALFPGEPGVVLTPDQAMEAIQTLHKKEDDARYALRQILTLAASLMPEYHNGGSPTELEVQATVKQCLEIGRTVLK